MKKPKDKKHNKKRPSRERSPSKKQKKGDVWFNVLPNDLRIKIPWGTTILGALQGADVVLEGDCGGLGKCGKCKVKVLSPMGPCTSEEKEFLAGHEIKQGVRLACRNKVKKDLVIHIGKTDLSGVHYQILKSGRSSLFHIDPLVDKQLASLEPVPQKEGLSDLDRIKLALGPQYHDLEVSLASLRTFPEKLEKTHLHGAAVLHGNYLMAWQNRQEGGRHYGLVFDVGTSTLVGKLTNLLDGSEVVAISGLNSQIKYGTDVISRIQYVKEHPNGLKRLNDLLIEDLNRIIERLLEVADLHPEEIFIAVAAGNTTMQHFLLGLNPVAIAGAPFTPVTTDGLIVRSAEVGLKLHPEALLYVMPAKSAYIGGDLTSFVISSGAAEQEDNMILGLDLGTNGEIFLGNRRKLMTCSAAAGPALEGAKISHGMIAQAGAIEAVNIKEGNLSYQVIGNIKPQGICGSGLVDLVAALLDCGILNDEGLIQPRREGAEDSLGARLIKRAEVYDFLVASADEAFEQRPIYLIQKDVRELQLAKGAVAAGIRILMDRMGIGINDIDRIYLAGAFANYMYPHSAMRIGLIPRVAPEIIKSLGNAASTGASMVLLSKNYWQIANDIAHSIEHVELSSSPDFNQRFIESLNFPEENIW